MQGDIRHIRPGNLENTRDFVQSQGNVQIFADTDMCIVDFVSEA